MSTRGAFGVKLNNKLFMSYNHGDSYPSGLGQEMVDFCKSLSNEKIELLKNGFNNIKIIDPNVKPTKEEQEKYIEAGFYNSGVSKCSPDDWYCLLRDLQGISFLKEVISGRCGHLKNSDIFLKDSLFCEYAYIIDLDKCMLEFYEGFRKEPDSNSPLPFKQVPDGDGYYPVKFMGKAEINNIPEDWIKVYYPEDDD